MEMKINPEDFPPQILNFISSFKATDLNLLIKPGSLLEGIMNGPKALRR